MKTLYNFIESPITNEKFALNTQEANNILLNYLQQFINNDCKKNLKKNCNTDDCGWIKGHGCIQKNISDVAITQNKVFGKTNCSKYNKNTKPKCNNTSDCDWIVGKGCKNKNIEKPIEEIFTNFTKIDIDNPELDILLNDIEEIVNSTVNNTNLNKSCTVNEKTSFFTKSKINKLIKEQKILFYNSKDELPELEGFGNSDNKRFLSDEMTDFNSNYFFSNKNHRLKFINLVTKTIQKYLDVLRPHLGLNKNNINIIFKGGIIIRFFLKELIRDFGNETDDYFSNIINKYIKIGDFDFEIISNPKEISPILLNKINIISQLIILRIRNHLLKYKKYYFDIFNYNKDYQQNLLQITLNKLNHLCSTKDNTNFYNNITIDYIEFDGDCIDNKKKIFQKKINKYDLDELKKYKSKEDLANKTNISTCRTDFSIIKDMDNDENVYFILTKNLLKEYKIPVNLIKGLTLANKIKGSQLYSTYNPNILFKGGDGFSRNFQLNRIKYNYIIYFKKQLSNGKILYLKDNIPGEILDLSHSLHKDVRKIQKHIVPYNDNDYFRPIHLLNYNINFMTYTIKGLITDLTMILFNEHGHKPWKDIKYLKRLYRLIFLVIFYYFMESKNQREYISYRNKIRLVKKFIKLIETNFISKFDFKSKLMNDIKDDFHKVYKNVTKSEKYLYDDFKNNTVYILKNIYLVFFIEQNLIKQKKLSIKYLNEDLLLNN